MVFYGKYTVGPLYPWVSHPQFDRPPTENRSFALRLGIHICGGQTSICGFSTALGLAPLPPFSMYLEVGLLGHACLRNLHPVSTAAAPFTFPPQCAGASVPASCWHLVLVWVVAILVGGIWCFSVVLMLLPEHLQSVSPGNVVMFAEDLCPFFRQITWGFC